MKFTKHTLNLLLEDIVKEYFSEEPHDSLQDTIDYVIAKYEKEISTLEEVIKDVGNARV